MIDRFTYLSKDSSGLMNRSSQINSLFVLLLLVVVIFPGLISGQQDAALQGTVTDAFGAILPGVPVKIKLVGSECMLLTLSNEWAVGWDSGFAYLSGGGMVYKFQKVSGKWVGESVGGWIS